MADTIETAVMLGWLPTDQHTRISTMEERWKLMYGEHQRSPIYSVSHYITYLRRYVADTGPPKLTGGQAKGNNRPKTVDYGRPQDSISPISYFIRKLKLDLKMSYQSFVHEFLQPPNNGLRLLLSLLRNISHLTFDPGTVTSGTLRLEEYKKNMVDENDCLLCIKYTLRIPNAAEEILDDNVGLLSVTSCLMSHYSRSRVTALEILTLLLTGPSSVDKILDSFTTMRIKHAESTRFKMLVSMMYTRGAPNIIFQVCCLRLFNCLLSLCRSANMRVYLQHELEEAGLDCDRLYTQFAQGDGLEYDDLRKEIREWKTRFINVDSLLRKIRSDMKSESSSKAVNEYNYDQHFGGGYNQGWVTGGPEHRGFIEYTDWLVYMQHKQTNTSNLENEPPTIPGPRPAVYFPTRAPPIPVTSSLHVDPVNTLDVQISSLDVVSTPDSNSHYDVISSISEQSPHPPQNQSDKASNRDHVRLNGYTNGHVTSVPTVPPKAAISKEEDVLSSDSGYPTKYAITNVTPKREPRVIHTKNKQNGGLPDSESKDSNWSLRPKEISQTISSPNKSRKPTPQYLQVHHNSNVFSSKSNDVQSNTTTHATRRIPNSTQNNHSEIQMLTAVSGQPNTSASVLQQRPDRPSQIGVKRIQSQSAMDLVPSVTRTASSVSNSESSIRPGPLKWYNPGISDVETATASHGVRQGIKSGTVNGHVRGLGTRVTQIPRTPSPDYISEDIPRDTSSRPLTYPRKSQINNSNVPDVIGPSLHKDKEIHTADSQTPSEIDQLSPRNQNNVSTQKIITGAYQNVHVMPTSKTETTGTSSAHTQAKLKQHGVYTHNIQHGMQASSVMSQSTSKDQHQVPVSPSTNQNTVPSKTASQNSSNLTTNIPNETSGPSLKIFPLPRHETIVHVTGADRSRSESKTTNVVKNENIKTLPTQHSSRPVATPRSRPQGLFKSKSEDHVSSDLGSSADTDDTEDKPSVSGINNKSLENPIPVQAPEKVSNANKTTKDSEQTSKDGDVITGTDSVRSYSAEIGRVLSDLDLTLENHGWRASIKSHIKTRNTLIAYV